MKQGFQHLDVACKGHIPPVPGAIEKQRRRRRIGSDRPKPDYRHQRCDTGTAGDECYGATIRRRPRGMSPDRPTDFKNFSKLEFVRDKWRHLSVGEALDQELQLGAARGRRNRVAAPRLIPVFRDPRANRRADPQGIRRWCFPTAGKWSWGCAALCSHLCWHPRQSGVALITPVPLLFPRVAPHMVSAQLPEARLVAVGEPQTVTPFGALPEVQVRNEKASRTSVLSG